MSAGEYKDPRMMSFGKGNGYSEDVRGGGNGEMDEFDRMDQFSSRMTGSLADGRADDSAPTPNGAPKPKAVYFGTPIAHSWSAASMASASLASAAEEKKKKPTRYVSKISSSSANGSASDGAVVDGATATFMPLKTALPQHNLSTNERCNVKALYVQSAVNNSPHPIKIEIHGVNGNDVLHNAHSDGSSSAIMLAPRESKSFTALNEGRGMFLRGNELDSLASFNVMSKGNLLEDAKVHEGQYDAHGKPKAYLVDVDLSKFMYGNTESPEGALNHDLLGNFVFSNAFSNVITQPHLVQALDKNKLGEYTKEKSEAIITSAVVVPKPFSENPGEFQIKVDGQELRAVYDLFKQSNLANAQPTDVSKQKVSISRTDAKDKPLQEGDVHVQLNWEVQHNGVKHKD